MKITKFIFTALSLIALSACGETMKVQKSDSAPALADSSQELITIYSNGDIVTVDEQQPSVAAIAVKNGEIIAAGNLQHVQSIAGDGATNYDLKGNTLLPSFIDAHGHIAFTAQTLASANVSSPPVGPANSVEDVLNVLRSFRDKQPNAEWVFGWGYDDSLLAEKRHPTREDLDKVSTKRPIALRHVSGHFMSCNSKCLELAGITADTVDPDGGIIRRMPGSNVPDGVLEETAMAKLYALLPQPSKEQKKMLYAHAQKFYARHGITTVQDGAASLDDVDLFREIAAEKPLMLDVVSFPYALLAGDRLSEYKSSQAYENGFRVGGFKLVLDGSPQGKTAWMTKPYLHPPHGQKEGYAGYATLKDEQVSKLVDYGFSNNIPLIAHANGDAAADQLIRTVKSASKKYGKADRRTVMIHAQTVRDDQIDDMIAYGILPSYFSAHTFYWGDWHRDSVFGIERAERISPLRTSTDKGLLYTTHNDTPIVPPDMMRLIWASVNRVTRSGQVLGNAQRASAMEAIKSVTINAAHQYFEEDRKGSLKVGKLADLVILDANPLKVDRMTIKDIKILTTIKNGQVVYQAK